MKLDPKTEFRLLILEHLNALGLMSDKTLKSEIRFHKTRDWCFDFAIPELMIAFEYEGIFANRKGQSGKSRHLTVKGFTDDCEKYTWASILDWIVVRITPSMIQDGRAGPLIRNSINTAMYPTFAEPFRRVQEPPGSPKSKKHQAIIDSIEKKRRNTPR